MKSNDIIVEYKIGDKARSGLNKARNFFRGKDYNPQDPDGLNKGDPKFGYPETPETPETPNNNGKAFTLPKNNSSASRIQRNTRTHFVQNFVDTIYDLVYSQLEAPVSYIAKPGKTIDPSTQVSLDTYLSNWYNQYTAKLKINDNSPFGKMKNNIFREMQKNWNNGVYDEALIKSLGEQTYAYSLAGASTIVPAKDIEAQAKEKENLEKAETAELASTPVKGELRQLKMANGELDTYEWKGAQWQNKRTKKMAEKDPTQKLLAKAPTYDPKQNKPATVTESSKRVAKLKKLLEK